MFSFDHSLFGSHAQITLVRQSSPRIRHDQLALSDLLAFRCCARPGFLAPALRYVCYFNDFFSTINTRYALSTNMGLYYVCTVRTWYYVNTAQKRLTPRHPCLGYFAG